MYVATLALPGLNWLIRVDCTSSLIGSTATYQRTDAKGNVDAYTVPIGPDTNGIGLPTIAILDLIKDLNFAEVDGPIRVVHTGAIDQDELEVILRAVSPAYALRDLCTTGVAQ